MESVLYIPPNRKTPIVGNSSNLISLINSYIIVFPIKLYLISKCSHVEHYGMIFIFFKSTDCITIYLNYEK